ncbi:zinc ribbon domain-containing protein [Corallococcus carmarthensis]|uniref:Zinc ribbon domain-containing protein n=1 Tax=Corallococcus carmarthensis TaxID=2316728 RepID=A0A3A8JZQ4_9BACT|nr:zinc ribbon domain-containing protein [Corallococcus carmarthensis]RKH00676.1 zinc ribbon domain-containing protein [Corallococcus carmarthensis]
MQCPECGESAADVRLAYCENCGAKMPARPASATRASGVRSNRPSRPMTEPAYASELMDEEEEARQQGRGASAPPRGSKAQPPPPDAYEDEDPYTGPRWLKDVPGHSQSVVGVGLVAFSLVLSILPFFPSVGVLGTLLTLVGCVALVARELRRDGNAPGWVEHVPLVLMRPEAPAAFTLLLVALTVRLLSGFNLLVPLWAAGTVLIALEQSKLVIAGPDGVGRDFDARSLLGFPRVLALAGVAVCVVALFLPWGKVMADGSALPDNAPVPGSVRGAPPELRVLPTTRPSDDSLYSLGGGVTSRSGWDLPLSELPLLALLSLLVLAALRPEVERPAFLRWVPVGAVSVSLLWALAGVKLAVGPFVFLFGLGAVGFHAVRHALGRDEPQAMLPPEDDDAYDPDQDLETESDSGYRG